MSFWKRLFGAPDAAKEAIGVVKDGLDAIWYTDEEKASDAIEERREARGVLLEWIKNSQGQNLSRRFIAILITLAWLIFKLIGVIVAISSIWVLDKADQLKESANLISQFSSDMTSAMMLILGFYFAAPHMGRIAEAALVKFGKTNDSK